MKATTALGFCTVRTLQFLFAAIVFGLSLYLAIGITSTVRRCDNDTDDWDRGPCDFGYIPVAAYYAVYVGAFGLIEAVFGLIAAFVNAVPWAPMLVVDGVAVLSYLAGGILFSIARTPNYPQYDFLSISVISCGSAFCNQWAVAAAFMFLGFVVSLVALGMMFLRRRSESKDGDA